MQEIGPQHGIKASYQRLKVLDPNGCNPLFNPDTPDALPLSQLKAWDKWCRTMLILVADHDAQIVPPPSPPDSGLGVFAGRYAFIRDPNSGFEVEKLSALRAAGYVTVAFNVADHAASEWSVWITHAGSLNVIPWGRVHTATELSALRAIAESWTSAGLLVNLEQEATDPRWLMTGTQVVSALTGYAGSVGISTEPWMPDNFDWAPLIAAGYVCLPQSLVNENLAFSPSVVVMRAQSLGWAKVVPSFGVYTTATMDPVRADYEWPSPFGIYALDDLQPAEIGIWI